MFLIADAGSTKVQWCAVSPESRTDFVSPGINAAQLSEADLARRFADALKNLCSCPDAIYYYGAGCATPEICAKVADALRRALNNININIAIEVASDMLGAARALFGRAPGLALILGTGSNSALYDGHTLTANMPPLGYILGDEGSGAALGKRLLNVVFRTGLLRPELEQWLHMSYGDVIARIYRQPEANKFLASLVPFIVEHAQRLSLVINSEFDALFNAISPYYPLAQHLRAVGGVANALAPQLRARAELHGFTIDQIQERPIEGLIAYHLS